MLVEFPKLGLSFDINPVAFTIGDFEVFWYGIIIAAGFLLAILYASLMTKRMNIDINRLFDTVIVGLIAGVICARLFYVAFYPGDKYIENPAEILKIHDGGLAIYGALIGALVFGGITAKLRKLKVAAVFDVVSLGFLIGQCLGRWGNFVNQEAFGTATDLPWGMISERTMRIVPDSPVHPCFLYESLLCLLGFILLHFFNLKLRRYDGQTFLLYIIWYGACRFFIEGLRTDSLMIPYLDLRVSQVIAAGCVIVGIILLIVFRHKTSLTGCGSKAVMEGIGLDKNDETEDEEASDEPVKSTIFGDLPQEEIDEIYGVTEEEKPSEDVKSGDTEEKAEENKETNE